MSRWIETEDGDYVNLDHVVRAKPITKPRTSKDQPYWDGLRLELVSGEHVTTRGTYRPDRVSLYHLLAETIPAAPGQEALLVSVDDEFGERPTKLRIERYPIVGWRVHAVEHADWCYPTPLLPVSRGDRGVIIVLPGGRLLDQWLEDTEYDDIEAMKANVLAGAQAEWDRQHAPKTAGD
jgi:hypothetical protein